MKHKVLMVTGFIIASILTFLVINGTFYEMCNGNKKMFSLVCFGAEAFNVVYLLWLMKGVFTPRR